MMQNYFDFKDTIGIISNDAGSANLIKAWISNNKIFKYFYCLSGPALKIFNEKDILDSLIDLDKLIEICNVVITGTSYSNNLEHIARLKSKKNKIKSIAVIDHWVNYERRFIRNDQKILPDIIWVFDTFAEKKAKDLFKKVEIQKQRNYYINDLVKKIIKLEKNSENYSSNILYVLEPIRKNKINGVIYEFLVLDFFMKNIDKLNLDKEVLIRLRLHPSENKNKYDDWIKKQNNNNINISINNDLCEDISWSNIVVGYESYALVIASAASKKCFSSKLPDEENCRLMIKDLEYIRDLC